MRVFLDEINTWIKSLSKADLCPQCGWASTNHLKAWIEFSLSLSLSAWLYLAGTLVFSCLRTQTQTGTYAIISSPSSQVLGLGLGFTLLAPWISSLPTTDDCTHLNAEFQRIARRDKTGFLSHQCKEIEENNRMGKTRDLFREIRDTEHFMQRWAQQRTEMGWT